MHHQSYMVHFTCGNVYELWFCYFAIIYWIIDTWINDDLAFKAIGYNNSMHAMTWVNVISYSNVMATNNLDVFGPSWQLICH
jgi:hypothetical protein